MIWKAKIRLKDRYKHKCKVQLCESSTLPAEVSSQLLLWHKIFTLSFHSIKTFTCFDIRLLVLPEYYWALVKAFTRAHFLCQGHNPFLLILSLTELPSVIWKVIDNFFFAVSQREILIIFVLSHLRNADPSLILVIQRATFGWYKVIQM